MVEGSDDGVSFRELATGSGSGALTVIPLQPLPTVRVLRIRQTGSSPVNWWSIHEMAIFAPAANAVLQKGEFFERAFGADLEVAALEGTLWGDAADPDGDGLANALEFAFNLDPLERDAPSVVSVIRDDAGRPEMLWTFRQWREGNGLTYHVESSDSLAPGSWTAVGIAQVGEATDNEDGTETVRFRRVMGVSDDRAFGRVRIEQE